MMFRKFNVLAIVLAMMIAMTGCGGSSSNTSQNSDASASNNASSDAGNTGAAAAKIIRRSVSGTPKVDPAVGSDGGSTLAMVNLYDSLVYPVADGTVEPSLAESWEVSDDNLTYTFKVREGVKFHNGDTMTANDVAFSMNRLLKIGEGPAYLFEGYVESAEAADDSTVVFHMVQPFGPFIETLTKLYIVNEAQIMDNLVADGPYGEFGDYAKEYMLTHDAGTGAYMLVDIQQQGYVLADRFEDYWRGWDNTDAPDQIKFIDNVEASSVRTMIGNRELEITDEWQSTENINAMNKIEGVEVAVMSTGMTQNMMYNTKLAPTDDANFRKALNCLFDYQMISDKILIDSPVSVGPVSANTPGASTDLMQYTYDIEKAKDYLSKSKYANNLADYPVELFVNSDVADHEKIALAFQAAAQQAGITVDITKGPWLAIQERVATVESTPNMLCISVAPHYMEAGSMLATRYHSNSVGTWEQAEWLQSDEIDGLIEDALATTDRAARFEQYDVIQKKLVDIAPTAWLVDLSERHIYQSAYVYWPVAESAKEGTIITLPLGYTEDYRLFKVFPDQIPQ
ncbi:ABC transporter substrate-binding protein [Fusibacter paucivorans]|uniref:ABC transporter substrate-binding protein n=1 Tax=Fusibacter paucivorans TaxID=76009 RepID=A0ABS5PQR9_9FIRM|nr:ABC transporter substrate-binding protein [Fusibacter paucivorans]MBS7527499.1 ABC transporter substrate-binding protein [Fusibacter paucivorans]